MHRAQYTGSGDDWQAHMKEHFDDLRVFEGLEGCGHWLPMEAAETVNAKLIEFLGSILE